MATTVKELQRLAEENKDKIVRLYNPTTKDFVTTRCEEDGEKKEYVIRSGEIVKFPYYIAKHLKPKLLQFCLNEKFEDVPPPLEVDEVRQEIEVTL